MKLPLTVLAIAVPVILTAAWGIDWLVRRKLRYLRGKCAYCGARAGDPHGYGCEGWRAAQSREDDAA